MIGKIYISNKNAMVPGIRRGFLRIVRAPKSAGIFGQPQEFRERIAQEAFKQDRHQNAT